MPMAVGDDAGASNCAFVASPSGSIGTATLGFTVTKSAGYYLWVRVRAGHQGMNSFYVSVDGGPEVNRSSRLREHVELATGQGRSDGPTQPLSGPLGPHTHLSRAFPRAGLAPGYSRHHQQRIGPSWQRARLLDPCADTDHHADAHPAPTATPTRTRTPAPTATPTRTPRRRRPHRRNSVHGQRPCHRRRHGADRRSDRTLRPFRGLLRRAHRGDEPVFPLRCRTAAGPAGHGPASASTRSSSRLGRAIGRPP